MYLGDLCCICLRNPEELKRLTDTSDDGLTIYMKFTSSIPQLCTEAVKNHGLVCISCYADIEDFFIFRTKCLENIPIFLDKILYLRATSESRHEVSVSENKPMNAYTEADSVAYDCHGERVTIKQEELIVKTEYEAENDVGTNVKMEYEIENFAHNPSNMYKHIVPVESHLEPKTETEFDVKIEYDPYFEQTDPLKLEESEPTALRTTSNIENPSLNLHEIDDVQLKCNLNVHDSHQLSGEESKSNIHVTSVNNIISANASSNLQVENSLLENSTDNSYNVSKIIETALKTFECKYCSKTFSESAKFKKHERTHTIAKPFQCQYCPKSFSKPAILKTHEFIHTGEKPFQCKFCTKSYARAEHLQRHERVHTGENLVKCNICDKSFARPEHLKIHERIHTGERPYECKHCSKSFIVLSHMKRHERIHTGERPYKCKHCSKTFPHSGTLMSHERTHTGERPYECKYCPNNFATLKTLTNHERIHTGERPFKCKFCSKAFIHSGPLTEHERVHTGERPYGCKHCPKSFATLKTLKGHQRVHDSV